MTPSKDATSPEGIRISNGHASGAVDLGDSRPIDFATSYLDSGLCVIPIKGDGTKSPALNAWKQYESRLPTRDELRRGFLADNIGVAVIHGAVSGSSECIDFDYGALFDPFVEEVRRLAPGLVSKLTIIQTPREGGGYHVIYRCSEIEGSQKLAFYIDDEGKRKASIETKGEGGYTLAPGSPGCCHETGGQYEHISGPPLTELTTITPAERALLLRVARSFNQIHEETPTTTGKAPTDRGPGLSPGDDFNQRAQWPEILESHGWVCDHGSGAMSYWRRPGKSVGWSATTGVQSTSGTELFCCFSDNAHPFTGATGRSPCTSYSKFAAYAVLNHGGDYSAAAKQLASDGYGERRERVHDGADKFYDADSPQGQAAAAAAAAKNPPRDPLEKFTFRALAAQYPTLHAPVIQGLIREGETGNFISVPKIGKSYSMYGLALSVITGRPWLNRFDTVRGQVLIVDNELHRPTIAHRVNQVADAMGLDSGNDDDDFQDALEVWPLRGRLRGINELVGEFDGLPRGYFKLIILDAKYRFAVGGASENDNAAETVFYNSLDQLAAHTGSAIVAVHHSSKGGQGDKRTTDVGAGAGAQSRAADCHMILREHEEENVIVLDAAVRSFAPVKPLALRWEFPLFIPALDVDPAKLKGKLSASDVRQSDKDREGVAAIGDALMAGPLGMNDLARKAGMGKDRAGRLVGMLERDGQVVSETATVRHNLTTLYRLNDTETEGGLSSQTTRPDHQTT